MQKFKDLTKTLKNFIPQFKVFNFFSNRNNYLKYALAFLVLYFILDTTLSPKKVSFDYLKTQIQEGKLLTFRLNDYTVKSKDYLVTIDGSKAFFKIFMDDVQDQTVKLQKLGYDIPKGPTEVVSLWEELKFFYFIPVSLYISFLFFGLYLKNVLMNFKSRSGILMDKEKVDVHFSDVCGIDNVREELEEVVAHFKDSSRVKAMGGKTLKGVMMSGPPGTGKTLMAKAVATECKASFIPISGSQFVELYVGMGAKRVRELFETARQNVPCVIFIDEIDAFALKRGSNRSHSEYDQTVNEMLAQMDGFKNNDGVLVIAATNRLDNIDEALLRPGRFDRKINVSLPSLAGRKEILNLYIGKNPKMSSNINVDILAKATTYFSGADLKNLVDEAIYFAIRSNSETIETSHFMLAKDKIQLGVIKDGKLSAEDKKMTAYHEMGHAIVSYVRKVGEVSQVSIIPRGNAMGVTQMVEEDVSSYSKDQLISRIMMLMGGKVAEKVFCHNQSTGASDDLKRATDIARRMVSEWGMSPLGPISFANSYDKLSEQMKFKIDEEVLSLLTECENMTTSLIHEQSALVEKLTLALLEKETISYEEFAAICKLHNVVS